MYITGTEIPPALETMPELDARSIVQVDVENDADRTVQADASQESQHGGQLHPVSNSPSSLFFSRFLLMSANAHPRDGSFR
jgi:hypothetical protein